MGTKGAAMVSALGLIVSLYCSVAFAHCDLSRFDQTPPTKVKDVVDNQFAHFEWASDVDVLPDRLQVWNYILNQGTRGLGAVWEKAGIRIPLTRPLPPGQPFCNRFLADSVLKRPDTDAPIQYGTNSQVQRAAVYVPIDSQGDDKIREVLTPQRSGELQNDQKPQHSNTTGSAISTSYADENGKLVDVNVELSSGPTPKGFYFHLYYSPGLIVGVSGFPNTLSEVQIETMTAVAQSQNTLVNRATYGQYTKEDPTEALAGLFPEKNGLDAKADFLFFSGKGKVGFEIPAAAIRKVSANVIVLDQKLRPILASAVTLFAPVKE